MEENILNFSPSVIFVGHPHRYIIVTFLILFMKGDDAFSINGWGVRGGYPTPVEI